MHTDLEPKFIFVSSLSSCATLGWSSIAIFHRAPHLVPFLLFARHRLGFCLDLAEASQFPMRSLNLWMADKELLVLVSGLYKAGSPVAKGVDRA